MLGWVESEGMKAGRQQSGAARVFVGEGLYAG